MQSTGSLAGRVAVVTGGGSGIGRAVCLRFAAAGVRVIVADQAERGAQETVQRIQRQALESAGAEVQAARPGPSQSPEDPELSPALAIPTDVTSAAAVDHCVARALEAYGRLDIMCNNAGVAGGAHLLDWSAEQYEQILAVNQHGVFYGIQAAGRVFREQGQGGVIINTGSVYGELAALHTAPYQVAKGAVEIMTKVAARELASYGVRVVNVAPGVVDTPIIEPYRQAGLVEAMAHKHMRGKLIRPDHVAQLVVFLASDAANAVNGTTVFADDGYSAFK